MSILPKGLFLILKILAVLSDQEDRLVLLVAGETMKKGFLILTLAKHSCLSGHKSRENNDRILM